MDRTVFWIDSKAIAAWKGLYNKKESDTLFHDGFKYRVLSVQDSFEKDDAKEWSYIVRNVWLVKQS